MKEAASAQGIWNVTDVNHLNEDARQNAKPRDDLLLMRSDGSYLLNQNSFF
jgi:hypothetical protein